MKNFIIILSTLSIVSACSTLKNKVLEKSIGLKLKTFKITDAEVLSYPHGKFKNQASVGKLDTTFIQGILMDSALIAPKDRSEFGNFVVQPMNAIFFDSLQNLFAAYAICDADMNKMKFTWKHYLTKPSLKTNIDIEHKVKFEHFKKHLIILKPAAIDSNKKNVILVWSKMAGRQNKYFLKEFDSYLSNKDYNIYLMNLDYAMKGVDIEYSKGD